MAVTPELLERQISDKAPVGVLSMEGVKADIVSADDTNINEIIDEGTINNAMLLDYDSPGGTSPSGETEAEKNVGLDTQLSLLYDEPPYGVVNRKLVVYKNSTDFEIVSDIIINVLEEIIFDDGRDRRVFLKIRGYTSSGEELPEIEIPSGEFNGLKWITEYWGIKAVMPLRKMQEHFRNAVAISANKYAKRTTIFSHTGWRLLDTGWCYLHGGGAIGAKGILTKLETGLGRYTFSEDPVNIAKVLKTCLEVLEIAPYKITVPMVSLAFLSPLNEFLRQVGLEPSFIEFLMGLTKTKKTTLAALINCFFGDFTGKTLTSSFKDTANASEKVGYILKDSLRVVDDFHPTTNFSEKKRMDATAQALARNYGNRAGRHRMNADLSLQEAYIPRDNVIITGEHLPSIGASGISRFLIVEIEKNAVDVRKLTAVQAEKQDLALFMRAYIEWLIPQANSGTLPAMLKQRFEDYRNYYATIISDDRLCENISWLAIGFSMLIQFITEQNILSPTELQDLTNKGDALRILAEA
jgi:hypothetical protein